MRAINKKAQAVMDRLTATQGGAQVKDGSEEADKFSGSCPWSDTPG